MSVLTVPGVYCTVCYMRIEDGVLSRIGGGMTPSEVMGELGLNRSQYYEAIGKLEDERILSKVGELPEGAETEVCPPHEVIELFLSLFGDSRRATQLAIWRAVRPLCERYGWVRPKPHDQRYSRAQWTGHAVRRVDFQYGDASFAVHGFLVPRLDKKTWDRATPQYRLIYIETNVTHNPILWRMRRGVAVSADILDTFLSASGRDHSLTSPELYTALALAVAWVNESRAVLARTVGGGKE